mmetsp:Transcript_38952/g.122026  ORF Transcript_38952/g.122026 Transcript_38952/m.122026 type:complete len:275 (+) Transcript_38952:142-966(+)
MAPGACSRPPLAIEYESWNHLAPSSHPAASASNPRPSQSRPMCQSRKTSTTTAMSMVRCQNPSFVQDSLVLRLDFRRYLVSAISAAICSASLNLLCVLMVPLPMPRSSSMSRTLSSSMCSKASSTSAGVRVSPSSASFSSFSSPCPLLAFFFGGASPRASASFSSCISTSMSTTRGSVRSMPFDLASAIISGVGFRKSIAFGLPALMPFSRRSLASAITRSTSLAFSYSSFSSRCFKMASASASCSSQGRSFSGSPGAPPSRAARSEMSMSSST